MQRQPRHPSDWNAASSDEELVRWAQRGYSEAFGLLYDRHLGSVYGYCYRRLGEREGRRMLRQRRFARR